MLLSKSLTVKEVLGSSGTACEGLDGELPEGGDDIVCSIPIVSAALAGIYVWEGSACGFLMLGLQTFFAD